MIPSRVTRGARGHSDPMDVDAVNSLSLLSKEKYYRVRAMGVCKCGGAHFQRDCNARKSTGKQSYDKGNRASHGPRVSQHSQAKARVKKTRENPKENPKEPTVPFRNLHRHGPLTLLGTMVGMVTNGTMAGVSMNGMTTGVLLDGTKVGNKRMTLRQTPFHLEVWMSVPPVVRSGLNG